MSDQKDNDELTTAYLAGCYDTRKAYEQQLSEAEAKNIELEKELFILASDVIYSENDEMPNWLVDKARAIYYRPRLGKVE